MSGWPRDKNDDDYRDCRLNACPSSQTDFDAKC